MRSRVSSSNAFCRSLLTMFWFRAARCAQTNTLVESTMALAYRQRSTIPLPIAALIDGSHRTSRQTGFRGFIQIDALAPSMGTFSLLLARITPRWIVVIGYLLQVLTNMKLFLSQELYLQIVLGSLSGTGYGLAFSATMPRAANAPNPARIYATGNDGAQLISVGLLSVLRSVASKAYSRLDGQRR